MQNSQNCISDTQQSMTLGRGDTFWIGIFTRIKTLYLKKQKQQQQKHQTENYP